MSTPPVPRPPEESRRRQRRFLIGGAVVVASLVVALVALDRQGADRHENRERSNPEQRQGTTVSPTPSH